MVDRPCFRLEFSDGASIVADAEHQWVTATRALRFAQAERRRNERRERSIVRMERIEKLEAMDRLQSFVDGLRLDRLVKGQCRYIVNRDSDNPNAALRVLGLAGLAQQLGPRRDGG